MTAVKAIVRVDRVELDPERFLVSLFNPSDANMLKWASGALTEAQVRIELSDHAASDVEHLLQGARERG
jgi:hypothetical protein